MKKILERRNNKRASIDVIIEMRQGSDERVGRMTDVNSSGACIISSQPIDIGSKVKIQSTLKKPLFLSAEAVVTWVRFRNGICTFGIRYTDISPEQKESIRDFTDKTAPQKSILKLILTIGVPLVPIMAFLLAFSFPNRIHGYAYAVFMTLMILERLWETFFTSRETRAFESSNDWSITAVSLYYLLMFNICVLEFYFLPKEKPIIQISGLILLIFSFSFRYWGVRTLGKQWAVHAIGNTHNPTMDETLIIDGPYRFIRHPIYLGVILELIAIPLISISYAGIFLVLVLNIPLQIFRSRLEEKKLIERFGPQYLDYMTTTSGFKPKFK